MRGEHTGVFGSDTDDGHRKFRKLCTNICELKLYHIPATNTLQIELKLNMHYNVDANIIICRMQAASMLHST